jgi:hypothetical protein
VKVALTGTSEKVIKVDVQNNVLVDKIRGISTTVGLEYISLSYGD